MSLLSKFCFAVISIGVISCTHQNNQPPSTKEISPRPGNSKTLLQGAWFGKEYDEHAVFLIEGDSINYIEHFDKFKYRVSKDTFEILTTQPHYKELILRLGKDSLILKELPSGEINRYWRSE